MGAACGTESNAQVAKSLLNQDLDMINLLNTIHKLKAGLSAVIGDDKAHKKQKAWEKNRMADNGGKGGKGGRGDKYYANKRKQESGHHTKSKKKK